MVVAQPMSEMPGLPLSSLTEADGSVVGGVLAHVMDVSTVEMHPHTPLPQLLPLPQVLPVPLPASPLPIMPVMHTTFPQCRSPG